MDHTYKMNQHEPRLGTKKLGLVFSSIAIVLLFGISGTASATVTIDDNVTIRVME